MQEIFFIVKQGDNYAMGKKTKTRTKQKQISDFIKDMDIKSALTSAAFNADSCRNTFSG